MSNRKQSSMPSPAPKLGRFDEGAAPRAGGRLIDTWKYTSGLPGQAAIEVKVNLVTKSTGVYVFVASCPFFDAPLEDSDLTALRSRASELLQTHCTDRSGLVWEDWLEVMVAGRGSAASDAEQSMGLSIKYRTIQRAVLPDGKIVTVNSMGRISAFPQPHRAAPSLRPEELIFDDRNSGTEISYIPATPEALLALQQLQARLDQLRLSLSDLLTQEVIAERLQGLGNQVLALTHEVKA